MKASMKNVILVVLVVGLMFIPLFINHGAEFAGADAQAEKAITQISPGYKAWFKPIWEPPSSEIESLFFSLQAALGSGFVFYYIGYVRGKKARNKEGIERD